MHSIFLLLIIPFLDHGEALWTRTHTAGPGGWGHCSSGRPSCNLWSQWNHCVISGFLQSVVRKMIRTSPGGFRVLLGLKVGTYQVQIYLITFQRYLEGSFACLFQLLPDAQNSFEEMQSFFPLLERKNFVLGINNWYQIPSQRWILISGK